MNRGLTLIEIVVSVAIVSTLFGIASFSFNGYRHREILKAATLDVVSILREARAKSVVAEGDSVYGVHFDEDQVVMFVGAVYDDSDPTNKIVPLSGLLNLATTSLNANEVVFNRLSGNGNVSGSVLIYRVADMLASTTVTINGAGIISSP